MIESYLSEIKAIGTAMKNYEAPFLAVGYTIREIDDIGNLGETIYLGFSTPGTTEDVNLWLVKKITIVSGRISIRYAPNTAWDDRLTGTYI